MRYLHVSCGELKMTTRKTSKVWDYFELEGNWKVLCKLCNVKLAYNNSTGAMRNHILYRHVCISLEASQSQQLSIMSYTNPPSLRSVIPFAPSITHFGGGAGFPGSFRNGLLACSYLSVCLWLQFLPSAFFFKCRIASSPVFRQTTLTC